MVEIKTIIERTASTFDDAVNDTLAKGWELVRRECFITGPDRATTFYAELERVTEIDEYEADDAEDTARWERTRDPRQPYRCSACGYKTNAGWGTCPGCGRIMLNPED